MSTIGGAIRRKWHQKTIDAAYSIWQKEYAHLPHELLSAAAADIDTFRPSSKKRVENELDRLNRRLRVQPTSQEDEDMFMAFIEDKTIDLDALKITPLQWWLVPEQRRPYPRLHRMAINILSIAPSSAEPEQQFSGARRTQSWDRLRLSPENLQRLECMGNWFARKLISSEELLMMMVEAVDMEDEMRRIGAIYLPYLPYVWARDFNRKSWDKPAAVQHRQLDFEEWFGCNEHLKSPSNAAASYDKPPGTEGKAEEDLVWRLLVIDGFSGHGSFAFREYCIKFNILVAFLLPHSTHMLQPMDLGVFQWLKNAHQKRLRDALRKGNLSFNRRDFAGSFKEIFDEGFTPAHIITGFEKSGIFPPTEAIDPALSSLLPAENRFPLASDTARDVSNRYHDILSSPTLRGLESVGKIVSEAIVLDDIVRNHVEDRQGRIEKRYHQRKRGKRAKPVGEYIHNVSLEELREQHTEDVNAGNKAQQRLQLRNLRSFAIRQMEEIRDEWRKKKEVIVNGVEKRLQFKQWLEHTGKDVEYASYDASRAEIRSQLNKKEDFFTIDTQLAPEAPLVSRFITTSLQR
ncbi:hypothetical protein FOFC_20907 [Fusarium oxysporum]|nr:hypothetical protein FOFC_20907 [Fusarium oxysporum]